MRYLEGYDTVIGERGQKAVRRAAAADLDSLEPCSPTPPITRPRRGNESAVDNETEAAIQRSLERVTRDRTTVVIAHRLSTIRHADAIHVLEHGRRIESGTHEELLTRGGVYAGLWRVQTGERERIGS